MFPSVISEAFMLKLLGGSRSLRSSLTQAAQPGWERADPRLLPPQHGVASSQRLTNQRIPPEEEYETGGLCVDSAAEEPRQ